VTRIRVLEKENVYTVLMGESGEVTPWKTYI
jgi:hypothetical protein